MARSPRRSPLAGHNVREFRLFPKGYKSRRVCFFAGKRNFTVASGLPKTDVRKRSPCRKRRHLVVIAHPAPSAPARPPETLARGNRSSRRRGKSLSPGSNGTYRPKAGTGATRAESSAQGSARKTGRAHGRILPAPSSRHRGPTRPPGFPLAREIVSPHPTPWYGTASILMTPEESQDGNSAPAARQADEPGGRL